LTRDRSKAGEARCLCRFECSEFWHFDEEREGRCLLDARYAGQNGEPRAKIWVCFDAGSHLHLDGGDLGLDLLQPIRVLAFEEQQGQSLGVVVCGRAILDQRRAGDVERRAAGG
jgi:hypothetical protein